MLYNTYTTLEMMEVQVREVSLGNDWSVREVVGKGPTDTARFYFHKGRRAPRIPIDGVLAQQLAGYTLIEKDLRSVLIWLKEIERLVPKAERRKGASISPDRSRFDILKGIYVA